MATGGAELNVGTKIRLDGKYSGYIRFKGELEGASQTFARCTLVKNMAALTKTALPRTLTSARIRRQGAKASGLASRWTTQSATMTVVSAA